MDFLITDNGDGAEIDITSDGVTTTDGLETAAFLTLFCGEAWFDKYQNDSAKKYPCRFLKLRNSIPIVPGNLARFEDAAKKDLEELPVSNVEVSARIVGLNKLELVCKLDESTFEFTENWDAMRGKVYDRGVNDTLF